MLSFFFVNDSATPEIYTYCHTLSLHDALTISALHPRQPIGRKDKGMEIESEREIFVPCGPNVSRCPDAAALGILDPQHDGTGPKELLGPRSEEHTSELQSLMRISYAVFCLKKKTTTNTFNSHHSTNINK